MDLISRPPPRPQAQSLVSCAMTESNTLTPIPVVYDLPAIPDLAAKYATLTSAATKEEYEAVRLGIAELRQPKQAALRRSFGDR